MGYPECRVPFCAKTRLILWKSPPFQGLHGNIIVQMILVLVGVWANTVKYMAVWCKLFQSLDEQ